MELKACVRCRLGRTSSGARWLSVAAAAGGNAAGQFCALRRLELSASHLGDLAGLAALPNVVRALPTLATAPAACAALSAHLFTSSLLCR